jgi:hypothetical protein
MQPEMPGWQQHPMYRAPNSGKREAKKHTQL